MSCRFRFLWRSTALCASVCGSLGQELPDRGYGQARPPRFGVLTSLTGWGLALLEDDGISSPCLRRRRVPPVRGAATRRPGRSPKDDVRVKDGIAIAS